MSSNDPSAPLFEVLASFRQDWPKKGWSWDSRLSCIASAFNVDQKDEARLAVQKAFPHRWNHRSLKEAPPVVQQIAERAGGVRPDQHVLSTAPVAGTIAYGLWWPWGDEQTISLRIGMAGHRLTHLEERLREVFGVSADY